jgi:hypothetical protein
MSLPTSDAELFIWYVEKRLSISDIADVIELSISATRTRLLRAGVQLRSRREGMAIAGWKVSDALRGRRRTFSDEHRQNIANARRHRAAIESEST